MVSITFELMCCWNVWANLGVCGIYIYPVHTYTHIPIHTYTWECISPYICRILLTAIPVDLCLPTVRCSWHHTAFDFLLHVSFFYTNKWEFVILQRLRSQLAMQLSCVMLRPYRHELLARLRPVPSIIASRRRPIPWDVSAGCGQNLNMFLPG